MAAAYLSHPRKAPPLNIPASSATVTVRVIDSTSTIHCNPIQFLVPKIKGFDDVNCPAYCFLISHGNRHLLFDLGVRKDTENLAPGIVSQLKDLKATANVEKNVSEILNEDPRNLGIHAEDVEAIIWSHQHFDHTGNPALFPKSTGLVVGPGFKKQYLPGYPTNKDGVLLDSDIEDRNVREIDIAKEGNGLTIGQFRAFDYFSDGSFYLLDTPGHAVAHVCGLARITSSPDSFVFMGGDCAHHAGEFRPSEYSPLPLTVKPSSVSRFAVTGCPGALLQSLQSKSNRSASDPFLSVNPVSAFDLEQAESSVRGMTEFDADPNVLVVIAHDSSLKRRIDLYPDSINDWKAKDLDAKSRWCFCEDFQSALDS